MSLDGYDQRIGHCEAMAASYKQSADGCERTTDAAEWNLNMAQWHARNAVRAQGARDQADAAEREEARDWFRTNVPERADQAFAIWEQQRGETAAEDGWAR